MTVPYDHLSGKQRAEIEGFRVSLPKMTEAELATACDKFIWLSAYANNNPRSVYHWMCDFTYDECARRERLDIYRNAHDILMAQARG